MKILAVVLVLCGCQETVLTPPRDSYPKLVAEATGGEWLKIHLPPWYELTGPVTCLEYCQQGLLNSTFSAPATDIRSDLPLRVIVTCDSVFDYDTCKYRVWYSVP